MTFFLLTRYIIVFFISFNSSKLRFLKKNSLCTKSVEDVSVLTVFIIYNRSPTWKNSIAWLWSVENPDSGLTLSVTLCTFYGDKLELASQIINFKLEDYCVHRLFELKRKLPTYSMI